LIFLDSAFEKQGNNRADQADRQRFSASLNSVAGKHVGLETADMGSCFVPVKPQPSRTSANAMPIDAVRCMLSYREGSR
jgi:hypothetical protein